MCKAGWCSQTPLFLAAGTDRPAPSSSPIQREARQPNARGRLSLNRTPMAKATLVFFHLFGFRITGRHPHHQLLNVKRNPPFHQKPTGGSPLLEKAKKKKNHSPHPNRV